MLLSAGILSAGLLSGCVAVPRDQPLFSPSSAKALGLSVPDGVSPPAATATLPHPNPDVAVAPDWWAQLGDPQLDRIMAEALAGNPSLDVALARLREAQAGIARQKAGRLPQVTADASVERQRFSGEFIYPPPYGGSYYSVTSAEADLDWSLDLAGKQKALVAQARETANASRLDAEAARIAISGAVAQTYVNLARADAEARIADDFVASRQASLTLAQARRKSQLASDFDTTAAETLLAEARQAKVRAEGERQLMIHALAALAGHGAYYYAGIAPPALHLDAALPVPAALPADLLGRRPDILAARARIEASEAGRRAARAQFYPNIDIKAFLGASALGPGSLFKTSAIDGGAGPALHLPIFEGGALRAGYRGATAEIDIAIGQYNETVVRAVKEAADALSALETNAQDAAQQQVALRALEQTVHLDQVRLASGLSSRLDVLAAGQRLLSARQAMTDISADGTNRRIQLLVALGGGFAPAEEPGSAPVVALDNAR